ncbi:WXG100 family type VII secretion target [Nocardia abscessus]|uniref:WXG100 family type VII secretion target n=1 Tax=Nocardia abscessus TaxID=120957 RepID=UPI002454CA52|nr:hypothetical protein [Nocardia abscessus]
MAIDIPSEVALFLDICGIPYPDINEDDVRALAGHVRTFAAQVQDTHDSATGVIDQMGAFYSGESYQQLVATWAKMSSTHIRQLESASEIVGRALAAAATVITAVKVAVLAELAALAASYTAIMLTPPLAPSAPLVSAAARRLCEQMLHYLVGYIVAEVIGKAIEPLEQAIDDMVDGIVYDAARDALDVSPSSGTRALHIDSNEMQRFAKVLDDHADDIMQHAANFAENVAKLDFMTAPRLDDAANPTAADTTATDVRPSVGPAVAESSLRDAAVPDSVGPAYDAEAHRQGSAPDSPSAAGHLPVDGSVSGTPPGAAPLAQQSPGTTGTPWGRIGGQPATRSPLPLEAAERPAKNAPKKHGPAVTPWSKARRTRDVPVVVHVPSAGRPPVHVIREKEAEAGGAENAGPADAKAPSGVTAPPSDRMHPPGARG